MSNPIPKIVVLSAALGMCACSMPPPGSTEYNPRPKIQASPEPFPIIQPVTFTASIYAPNYGVSGGPHPSILELRAIPADKDGNHPAAGGVIVQSPFTAPASTNWSTVTFPPITVPAADRDGTLAVSVTYKVWSAPVQQYIPVNNDPEELRTTLFHFQCTTGTGETPAERLRTSLCLYRR